MRGFMQRTGLIMAVAAVIGACGSGGGTNNNGTITIAKDPSGSGDAQQAVVTSVLPQDLRVLVTEDGNPKAGQTITFTPSAGSVNPTGAVSDVNGIAKTTWTFGTAAGPATVIATLRAALGSPLTFNGTATPDAATALTKVAGDFQTTTAGTDFPVQLAVVTRDQFGNGVPGLVIDWAVLSGSLTSDATTSLTDAQGVGKLKITAGNTVGPASMRATTASLATHLDFTLTVAPPAKVVNASGSGLNVAFTSFTNATSNPAIDTIPVGGAIKWVQINGPHSVASTGVPSFTNSPGQLTPTGYTFVFTVAGTYQYECGVHGSSMTGTVVVQ
jgi:plastocyanin